MNEENDLNNALRESAINTAERLYFNHHPHLADKSHRAVFAESFRVGWDACMKLRIEVLDIRQDAPRTQATPEIADGWIGIPTAEWESGKRAPTFSSPRFDKTYCSHCEDHSALDDPRRK